MPIVPRGGRREQKRRPRLAAGPEAIDLTCAAAKSIAGVFEPTMHGVSAESDFNFGARNQPPEARTGR